MKRYIQRALLLATVVAMLGTGVTAGADEISIVCQTTKGSTDSAASAHCAALGEEMIQSCDEVSPCTQVVNDGTELGRQTAFLLRDMGVCNEEPGTTGECTAVTSGDNPAGFKITIKLSYKCCPREEWNLEIIINL